MARYVYHNQNPDSRRISDCVTRAISFASGIPYEEIRTKLYHTAKLLNCEKLCVCCYRHLLDDVMKYQRVDCDGLDVGQFADKHPYGTYLVRMGGHISTIVDGVVYDIFDCRSEVVTDAWKVI